MLQNIYRISKDKALFIQNKRNRQLEHKLSRKQKQYNKQALILVQQKLVLKNTIKLNHVLTLIKRKRIKQPFDVLKDNLTRFQIQQTLKIKCKLFALKVNNMFQKMWTGNQIQCFQRIREYSKQVQKIDHLTLLVQRKTYQHTFNRIKQYASRQIFPLNSSHCLSFLDISQIQIKNTKQNPVSSNLLTFFCLRNDQTVQRNEQKLKIEKKQIVSNNGIEENCQIQNSKQIKRLKQQIKSKKECIQLIKKQHQQQINALRQRLSELRLKNSQESNYIDSCHNDMKSTKEKSIELQKLDKNEKNNEDLLLAKLIRKNFEIEDKLQMINDLLSVVQPDMNTQFGVKLSSIIRKKCCHIQFNQII